MSRCLAPFRLDHPCARAFSLVELIIVIAIMAVIGATAPSRMSNRVTDASTGNIQPNVTESQLVALDVTDATIKQILNKSSIIKADPASP